MAKSILDGTLTSEMAKRMPLDKYLKQLPKSDTLPLVSVLSKIPKYPINSVSVRLDCLLFIVSVPFGN